nr:MAG TPA: hypothetical protein [Caudoviricetes sp.]
MKDMQRMLMVWLQSLRKQLLLQMHWELPY